MNILRTSVEPPDRLRLAVEAGVHPDSLTRYLRGLPVRSLTRRRIEEAALRLGIKLNEQAATSLYPIGASKLS